MTVTAHDAAAPTAPPPAPAPVSTAWIAVAGTVGLVAAVTVVPDPVKAFVVLPLAVGLPGWTTLRAALGTESRLAGMQVAALSVVLGMALVALAALGVDALSFRVTRTSVLVAVVGVVAVGATTAARRERRRTAAGGGSGGGDVGARVRAGVHRAPRFVAAAGVVLVSVAVIGVLLRVLPGRPAAPYAVMSWTSPAVAAGHPVQLAEGTTTRLGILMVDRGHRDETVSIRTGGAVVGVVDLRPGESWRSAVTVTAPPIGCHADVVVDAVGAPAGAGPAAGGLDGELRAEVETAGVSQCGVG